VSDFTVEPLREEIDCEADVCRVLELGLLLEIKRTVGVGFGIDLDLDLVRRTPLDIEVNREVMTLMRLALREELAEDFEVRTVSELSMLLL
jgi:hypothetical protein